MTEFIGEGGCYNGSRAAKDGAGQGDRDWMAPIDTPITGWNPTWRVIFSTCWDGDDMDEILAADFELQWRNDDGGSFAAITATGEIKWATDTDLINGNAVVLAEMQGGGNCSGMSDGPRDGYEIEGAASIQEDIIDGFWFDIQWAVDMSGATLGDTYEFRVVETGTSNVSSDDPCTATITMAEFTGTIDGITKDNAGDVLVSCKVALFIVTDEGPPEEYEFLEAQISDGATGAYSFTVYYDGSPNWMVYAEKDDTPHVFDATDNVIQPV